MHFWQKGKDFLTGLFFTWRKYKKKSRPSRERQLYESSLLSDSNQRPRDYKSRASLPYRAATTNYLCCDQALEDSKGAGRMGLTRISNILQSLNYRRDIS